jgi:hypothetical protein
MKLRSLYPEVYLEFTQAAVEETIEEARVRVELENPQIPLLNDTTSVVPQEVFDLWIDHPSQGRRQQAFQVAIEAVRDERRLLNQVAISANRVKTASYIYQVELVAKKRLLRLAMSADLLGPKFVSADCLVTIQADGRFLSGHGQVTPAFVIHQIIMERLQQSPGPLSEQRLKAQLCLRSMRQGNTRLDVFITLFKEQRDTCQDLQLQLTELELRDVFIGALNVEVFGMYKEEYYRDIPGLYPDTLNALFLHADAYYVRRCAAVPAMSHVLGDITGFAVYATYGNEEAFSQLPAPPGSPAISAIGNPDSRDPKPDVRPHCQLCDVPGHSALNCFSLRNPDTVKGYVDGVKRRGGRGGRGGRGR